MPEARMGHPIAHPAQRIQGFCGLSFCFGVDLHQHMFYATISLVLRMVCSFSLGGSEAYPDVGHLLN